MGFYEEDDKWRQERLGKFTASKVNILMQKGKSDYFGVAAKKYIRNVRGEIITREPSVELVGIKAIEWGHQYESEAIMAFEEWLGVQVRHFGGNSPKFFPHPKFPRLAGGSPDGMDLDEKEYAIEVKCPGWANHDLYLELPDAVALKIEEPDYYGQLQFNMHCSGVKKGYFISYHPNPTVPEIRLKVIEVSYDEQYMDVLNERLEKAIEMLNSGVWFELMIKIANS